MYSDVFCKVYNEFGWNYYPEIFGEQLLEWLRRNDVKTRHDLVCHRQKEDINEIDYQAFQ